MADVQVIQNADGDYFVGFDADGTFIPFHNVPANRVRQLQERAESLKELSEADDAASVERHDAAASGLPYTTKAASSKSSSGTSKGGGS